jgi:hypothetical protein
MINEKIYITVIKIKKQSRININYCASNTERAVIKFTTKEEQAIESI